jgi:hypothetical protein
MGEHGGASTSSNRMLTRIGRAVGCWQRSRELGICLTGPAPVVGVLGVPGGNQRIVHRHVQQGEVANPIDPQAVLGDAGVDEHFVPAVCE